MKFTTTPIPNLLLIDPTVFGDERGHFFESFHQERFNEAVGREVQFVQDNQSLSGKGILRGLHFQAPPYAQGKLVRVLQGSVLDVAVDLRKKSPTYGQHFAVELSAENKKIFWVPEGFGHGFVSLEENTIFTYKCTNYYHKQSEGSVLWNDADLGIDWGITNPIISEKDEKGTKFCNFISPF